MMKKRSKIQKHLAKMVLAALLCTGGAHGLISPSVAEAARHEITTDTSISSDETSTYADGVKMKASNIALTITSTGKVKMIESAGYNNNTITVQGKVICGSSSSSAIWGAATGTKVYIETGAYVQGEIYAGRDETSEVSGNKLEISSGTIEGNIFGGLNNNSTASYDVKNNAITISGSSITGSVIGGQTFSAGKASLNTVNISGDAKAITGEVVGGRSANSDATENKVIINGGNIGSSVIGGNTTYGKNATDNTVTIEDGTITRGIYGGLSQSAPGTAINNKVIINGGIINGIVKGGESDKGNATNNTVTIKGGTVTERVIGGNANISGDANGNTITISGGTIGKEGAGTSIWGGYASSGGASNNTVTISGDAQLLGNVSIYGAEVHGTTDVANANNNTVNILAKIKASQLAGGNAAGTSSGNTLNIVAKGVTARSVYAFQNMNFYLPSDIAKDDTMLTVNGGAETDVQGVTFGVAALSGVKLVKGDTVNLLVNSNGLNTDDTLKTTDSATLAKAEFLSANSLTTDDKYELSISKKGEDTIIATVDNVTEQKADEGGSGKKAVSIPDVLKSPVETRAGVVTLVNAGADLLVSQGMSNAADAAAAERTEGDAAAAPRAGGFAPFAAVSFGKLRAESGSHVDTKGIGMNLGFAREIANKNGKLLIGPVIEYGHGSYDSYQDSGIKADGKSSYWGIGVIAKQTNDNGFYYEGSLRAGRTKSDYNSDLRPGLHVNYDSSATYWAAHLGVGKLVDIGHDNTLDYYGKYFYSHTGSDSTYLNGANETANFDAVNSHRIRLGARLTHALNEKNKIYGGLAWQYEFKGDARATYSVSGEAPSPSVKGSSGMIELGWQVKPGKSPMTIDLGVTGWVGKQRGITANVQANWTF